MTDLWLAIAHHVLVFGLAMMLAAEGLLVREGMNSADAARVARLDSGYGGTASLVILIGILRVIYGAKGSLYYVENVWFWAKIASFLCVGLFSIPPTLRFFAWRSALKTSSGFVPEAADIGRVRFYIRMELHFLIAVIALAAVMARYSSI